MLVLTRKKGQEIVIDADIKIKILSLSDNQVRIGVVAPVDKEIFRGELIEDIKNTTKEAKEMSKQSIADISNLTINKIKDDEK